MEEEEKETTDVKAGAGAAGPTGSLLVPQPLPLQAVPSGLMVQEAGPLSLWPKHRMKFHQGLTSLERGCSFLGQEECRCENMQNIPERGLENRGPGEGL